MRCWACNDTQVTRVCPVSALWHLKPHLHIEDEGLPGLEDALCITARMLVMGQSGTHGLLPNTKHESVSISQCKASGVVRGRGTCQGPSSAPPSLCPTFSAQSACLSEPSLCMDGQHCALGCRIALTCAEVMRALTCPRADATMSRNVVVIFGTSLSLLFSASTSAQAAQAVTTLQTRALARISAQVPPRTKEGLCSFADAQFAEDLVQCLHLLLLGHARVLQELGKHLVAPRQGLDLQSWNTDVRESSPRSA